MHLDNYKTEYSEKHNIVTDGKLKNAEKDRSDDASDHKLLVIRFYNRPAEINIYALRNLVNIIRRDTIEP